MARPESQAIAGFVPVPPELYQSIASILRVTFASARDELVVADPCAGEGAALLGLAACWVRGSTCAEKTRTFTEGGRWEDRAWQHDPDDWNDNAKLFACEMEADKAGILEHALRYRRHMSDQNRVVHGDAFQLVLHAGDGVHVLWHNPPYDHDREHKRLEERFLRRFGPLVGVGGYLFHFVPFYALGASADTIAKLFEDVVCYRLPEPHFSVYKQVVLVGRRRLALATPDPATAAKVRAWGASALGMPELPLDGLPEPTFTLSTKVHVDKPAWTLGALDVVGVLDAYEPWAMTDRAGRTVALPNVEPEGPYTEILSPTLRLACAPRPGHLADACGAGVLSGVRLSPDRGQRGPRLLLKGIHRRTFRHLGWKEVKGERVAEERQHHPELNLSVLDLDKGQYHRLVPSVEPTNERDVSRWTVGDLLLRYSGGMLAAMRERCELIYDRERPEDRDMKLWPVSPDPLFDAQGDAVRASLKLLAEPDRAVVVLGQIGVGKTRIALTTAWHQLGGRGRVLVLCPPTLVSEWQKEVAKILPDARTVVVESITDLDDLAAAPPEGIEVAILTKEKAKLGHELAGVPICPRCGAIQKASPETLAEKRALCETVHYHPANGAARLAARVADGLGAVFPDGQLADVVRRVGGRILRAVNGRTGDWRARMKVVRSMARSLRRLVCRTAGSDTRQTLSFAWWSALHAVGDEAFMVREIRALFRASLSDREEYGAGKDVREIAARATLLLPPSSPWIRALLTEMESFSGRTYSGRFTPLTKVGDVLKANAARRRGEKIQDYWLTAFGAVGDVPTFGEREMGSDKALSFALERLCAVATWAESAPCYEPLYQATPKPRRIPIAKYLLRKHANLFDFMVLDECHVLANQDSAQSKAAQRLLSLRLRKRIPVMALSGSIMNGYARSLFVLLWHLSAAFRAEFDHDDAGEFERRYGFLVQVVEQVDENKKRVAYGKQSDRVTERTRTTGAAPGVLPTVPLRWLLPISVTIQLSDLEHELPPCRERIVFVQPTEEQRDRARRMEDKLFAQMASDRFKAGRAGRLFGALANLPRYYDHATIDVGNVPDGSWTIAYPEDTPDVTPAERVVTSVEGFAPATFLPGEVKLVEELRAALAEGRRFVVATTRTDLGKRLARVLRAELGVDVALLDTKKVKAADRRDWVDGVRASGAAGMVCNPAALPMGLNNLVGYFSVVVFYDDPNSDPTLLRQFRGRFVRIGQTAPVDVLIFVYEGTLQQDANDHLQKKRVVATATDGLDASAAFEVAGVGDGAVFEADLGKALYRLRAGQG